MIEVLAEYYNILNQKLSDIPYIQELETKYNLKKNYLLIFLGLFAVYYLILGKAIEIISNLFCFIYPGYNSFLCLQESKDNEKKKWLIYWIVLSCINSFEILGFMLLSMIPFYYLFKMIIVYWLISDKTNGCLVIYYKIIEPYLKINKDSIDNLINDTKNTIDKVTDNLKTNLSHFDESGKKDD